jgi:hypothetical protein
VAEGGREGVGPLGLVVDYGMGDLPSQLNCGHVPADEEGACPVISKMSADLACPAQSCEWVRPRDMPGGTSILRFAFMRSRPATATVVYPAYTVSYRRFSTRIWESAASYVHMVPG